MATLKYSPNGELLTLVSSPKEDTIFGKQLFSERICILHDMSDKKSDTQKILGMFDVHVDNNTLKQQVVAEYINPYVCLINYKLVVYFGEDKPILKSKSIKSCTSEFKRWTGYNWKNPKEKETYYYLQVNEPDKMFIFGNTYKFNNMSEEKRHETLEVVGKQYICKYDMSQEEWEKHMAEKVKKDLEEMKRREEWEEELQRRKETPGYCSHCGAEHAHLTVDPYNAEIYEDYTPVWLCSYCYESLLGDI